MNQHKIITVSIGIPAYNEENNIQNILRSLLKQREDNFIIKEIIVIDDGSQDQTVQKIKSLNNKKIQVIENKIRQGQVFCQNLIFDNSSSEITIIIEADILPKDNNYLTYLITPFIKDNSIALVQGNAQPLRPKTFLGKTITNQVLIYKRFSYKYFFPYTDIFLSGRGGKAYSSFLYKKLRWPMSVPEDIYAILWSLENGYKIAFEKKAICEYMCPQTLEDFLAVRQKVKNAQKTLSIYFNSHLINKIYNRPLISQIFMSFYFLIDSPIHYIHYLILKIYSCSKIMSHDFTDHWTMTISTKKLFN